MDRRSSGTEDRLLEPLYHDSMREGAARLDCRGRGSCHLLTPP